MNECMNAWMNEWTDKFATFQYYPFSENPDARKGQETQDVDTPLTFHELALGQFLIFS